ncbi:DUF6434 domain-containing protein [Melissococcus plutonius]|uniref:DUF6434 domain-containing protein n=1 Tax=Melissococcus plutonius (strain ATCC 35311 / DSM 29964 / CIP 104052 / LMG 20360 / NCIMB 702443) TaxID=940190 RepID=F3YBR1_MELPT|nr:DUF6434 domain-containing protein [Melissococcus plutonius]AIM25909.1 hypothetical protein MEPL_c013840 [Melissococcus plutonius S1]KMT24422.1 hypothetical protein MEPL3_6c01060 [Melissococcus plutonius]KMT25995.1 hypothetical protein MEPL1_6c01060 [Melissococcus plutonius]KMT28545.1 hypothetical protein MEPL4_5c01060 [Melissococcus plutonius]KMT30201.1 hypothetical protein MEPL7_5c01070 [Melissococcus plutonius]
MNRPELEKNMNAELFLKFYYLKAELIDFCRVNKLSTQGDKIEITDRIAYFLRTGKRKRHIKKRVVQRTPTLTELNLNSVIEENIKCSEIHRVFFKSQIGPTFRFNVKFQNWLKENSGEKYSDAIKAYQDILNDKTPTKIGKQFEYNTYIRDFFKDNKNLTLQQAIACWKFKKSQPGNNNYEQGDLEILNVFKKS